MGWNWSVVAVAAAVLSVGACGSSPEPAPRPSRLVARPHPAHPPSKPSATTTTSPTSTATDDACDDGQDHDQPSPGTLQGQYSHEVAANLEPTLDEYHAAIASGDAKQIGTAAGDLNSEIRGDTHKVTVPASYGCHDATILATLQQASTTFAATLDGINMAASGIGDQTPADVGGLVAQAQPQEKAYLNALNAYAGQFGGQQIAVS